MTKTHQEFIDEVSSELNQVHQIRDHFVSQRFGLIQLINNFKHNYTDFNSSEEDNQKLFRLHEDFIGYLLLTLDKREKGLNHQLENLKNEKQRQDEIDKQFGEDEDDIKPPSPQPNEDL